jgi:hypothetical protein
MQRLIRYLECGHEPVQRWEFRCVASVGLGLALVAVLLCTMVRWHETRQAAQTTGTTFAVVSLAPIDRA